eukprot:328163-Chlamydomonas_euryale.AAC.1
MGKNGPVMEEAVPAARMGKNGPMMEEAVPAAKMGKNGPVMEEQSQQTGQKQPNKLGGGVRGGGVRDSAVAVRDTQQATQLRVRDTHSTSNSTSTTVGSKQTRIAPRHAHMQARTRAVVQPSKADRQSLPPHPAHAHKSH